MKKLFFICVCGLIFQPTDAANWFIDYFIDSAEQNLIDATFDNDIKEVKNLIEGGVDVNAADKDFGIAALLWASYKGYKEIAKLLIEAGANVHEVNRYGDTALDLASRKNHEEIVELLVEAGARDNSK